MMDLYPSATFLKVTDSDTDTIVAVAKWNIYNGDISDEVDVDGEFWESKGEKELARETFAGYLIPRREAVRKAQGRIVCMTLI